jgi:hypothetical protein
MDAGRALDNFLQMALAALTEVFPGDEIYQAGFMCGFMTFSISRLILLQVRRWAPGLERNGLWQATSFCFACPIAFYLTLRIGTSRMASRA